MNHFAHIESKFKDLVNSDFMCFEEVSSKKNIMGVYTIYDDKDLLIYVGSTNKFHVRFGIDIKYESTHTLMRKFLTSGRFRDRLEASKFLKDACRIKIEICDSKREAEALESMAIYIMNPIYNK